MNKFWNFEKEAVVEYIGSRPKYDIRKFLDDKDIAAIEGDIKYGSYEYINDSVLFKPTKEDAKVITITIVLGNDTPKTVLETLLSQVRTPYSIAFDFWCISSSATRGLKVLYPSFGTGRSYAILQTYVSNYFSLQPEKEVYEIRF